MTSRNSKVSSIPVVILCGGRGTRLSEETQSIPKPLIHIGEWPMLRHIMKIYDAQGFKRFVLLLGYKGEHIKEYAYQQALYSSHFTITSGTHAPRVTHHAELTEQWEVTCIDTGLDTQTGSRLKRAQGFLKNDPVFMFTYGDAVADVDLGALLAEHKKGKKIVTMTGVKPRSQYGEIRIEKGRTKFLEKPEHRDVVINGGFFAVNKAIFSRIPDGDSVSFEQDVLPRIADAGELGVARHDGYWQSMDTLKDVGILNNAWTSGNAPWKLWQ